MAPNFLYLLICADETSGLDALQTLADLSLMIQSGKHITRIGFLFFHDNFVYIRFCQEAHDSFDLDTFTMIFKFTHM